MADINSIYCPKCMESTSLTTRTTNTLYGAGNNITYEIGECNSCDQHFLVIRRRDNKEIIQIYPKSIPKPVSDAIPELVRSDLQEAYKCLASGAFRAAATMARRALQNLCIDKGAPTKRTTVDKKSGDSKEIPNDLSKQIDWLLANGIITRELKDWAHEVRVVGNGGAHPGDAEDRTPITEEDARDALELTEALCGPLYISSRLYASRHQKDEESVAA